MLTTIQDIVYDFKLQAEKLDSKTVETLKLPQIISLLNKGMLLLIKRRYDVDPTKGESFESNQRRTQELQRLHILSEKLEQGTKVGTDFTFDYSKTSKPLMFVTRALFFGNKGECINQRLYSTEIQTDDISLNPDMAPSFEWRTTTFRYAEDRLVVRTDGTFEIVKAEIDYLRYPVKMDIAGYPHFDGTPSKDVQCELPEIMIPDIVSMATLVFKLWSASPDTQAQLLLYNMHE